MLQVESALQGYAKVRWLVVDTGTCITGRKVLVHPSAIGRADCERRELLVSLTKSQVKASPDIVQDQPVLQQIDGWDPYWSDNYFGMGAMVSPLSPSPYFTEDAAHENADIVLGLNDGDPHLHSIAAVTGYHIHASDGQIGHVENFLIDDATWGIRYLIIDTRNWWPGKHVLVSPYAVLKINWPKRRVRLDVSCEQVKSSPPWNPLGYYQPNL
jgi:hypothetical protein